VEVDDEAPADGGTWGDVVVDGVDSCRPSWCIERRATTVRRGRWDVVPVDVSRAPAERMAADMVVVDMERVK
jgi:hypothetical protein